MRPELICLISPLPTTVPPRHGAERLRLFIVRVNAAAEHSAALLAAAGTEPNTGTPKFKPNTYPWRCGYQG